MQIIARANLLAALTGPSMDPEREFQEELTAFANAIQAHAPAGVTHFVYTDHENGDDPVVSWGEHTPTTLLNLLGSGEVQSTQGNGYYGCAAQVVSRQYAPGLTPPADNRVLYHCYMGGSPLNSAPGFVVATAVVLA